MSDTSLMRDPYEDCPDGCEVKLPKANELFIDIDSEASYSSYIDKLQRLLYLRGIEVIGEITTNSKSGYPHQHIVLELKDPVTEIERVALQSILGSDPIRELIAYARIKAGNKNPTVFFEPIKVMGTIETEEKEIDYDFQF